MKILDVHDHSRDAAGMLYVYPVLSRRAGGVSVGINLNVNNACNWGCIYCQVPDLVRGGPPPVDHERLENELRTLLTLIASGNFMKEHVPPEFCSVKDIAFSGNGEPTSSPDFPTAVQSVIKVMSEFELVQQTKLRLITNGSLMHRDSAQRGIELIGKAGGEVWFKMDRATKEGMRKINGVSMDPEKTREYLHLCCKLAPTWIQTCCFLYDGQAMPQEEMSAYLDMLYSVREKIKGVLLYGLARPSMQAEAFRLSRLSETACFALAEQISLLGIKEIMVYP